VVTGGAVVEYLKDGKEVFLRVVLLSGTKGDSGIPGTSGGPGAPGLKGSMGEMGFPGELECLAKKTKTHHCYNIKNVISAVKSHPFYGVLNLIYVETTHLLKPYNHYPISVQPHPSLMVFWGL
jgi:hypothetical protein